MVARIQLKNKRRFLREFEKEFSEQSESLIEAELSRIIADLRANTPIDTGAASEGWSYRYSSLSSFFSSNNIPFTIVNEQEYILHVNDGTSVIAPRRFVEEVLLRYGVIIGTTFD